MVVLACPSSSAYRIASGPRAAPGPGSPASRARAPGTQARGVRIGAVPGGQGPVAARVVERHRRLELRPGLPRAGRGASTAAPSASGGRAAARRDRRRCPPRRASVRRGPARPGTRRATTYARTGRQHRDQPAGVPQALAERARPLVGGRDVRVRVAEVETSARAEGELEVELEPVALGGRRQGRERVQAASAGGRPPPVGRTLGRAAAGLEPVAESARSASPASVRWCAISSGVVSASLGRPLLQRVAIRAVQLAAAGRAAACRRPRPGPARA